MKYSVSSRYITTLLLRCFLVAGTGFSLLIVFATFLTTSASFTIAALEIDILATILLGAFLPELFYTVLPASAFFGTLYFSYHLLHDRELVALQSLGMHSEWLLRKVLYVFFPIFIVTLSATHFLIPRLAYQEAVTINSVKSLNLLSELQGNSFRNIPGSFGSLYLGGASLKENNKTFTPFFTYHEEGEAALFELATSATVQLGEPSVVLRIGEGVQFIVPTGSQQSFAVIDYQSKDQFFRQDFSATVRENIAYYPSTALDQYPLLGIGKELQKRTLIPLLVLLFPVLLVLFAVRSGGRSKSLAIIPLTIFYFCVRALYSNGNKIASYFSDTDLALSVLTIVLLFITLGLKRVWQIR